jgi:ABC-type multidrug transport system fused ATPase/permease subunit
VRDPLQPASLGAAQELVVQDVCARYGPEEPWVLEHANLRLTVGRRIALMGQSGAGKTTLAQLLVRFRDPDRGCIRVGPTDIRQLCQEDLRGVVVLAGQDAHMFNTSLRENILLARREASEEDVWRALDAAGLDAWARSLPDGLDTPVGQEGGLVSGGQRQRVALARALLSGARFLILDEPTAHLDADTAASIMRDIARGSGARGVLVITHSCVGLEQFDEVLELREGRIAKLANADREVPTGAA